MKLYQVATCPFAHRARIVLEEKKLPCSIIYFEPHARPSELARVSPDARSPTLFDESGNTWVWDSLVVIEYLEERYPDVPLMPKDAGARAHARLLMRGVESKLLPTVGPIVDELVHKPAEARDPKKLAELLPRFHEALGPWQARLAIQNFLLGDEFTLADIALYTPLYSMAGLVGAERAIPKTLTHLLAWRDRIAQRPSTAY
jgi:stringent starvation protein A